MRSGGGGDGLGSGSDRATDKFDEHVFMHFSPTKYIIARVGVGTHTFGHCETAGRATTTHHEYGGTGGCLWSSVDCRVGFGVEAVSE